MRVVELNTGKVQTFSAAPFTNEVALSPDGRRVVAVGGFAGEVFHLIDVETGEVRRIPNPQAYGLTSVAWSPDGRHIAAGSFGPPVVMDTNGRVSFFLEGHEADAYWVEWSSDSTRLLTGSLDGTAKVWEFNTQGASEALTLSARAGEMTGIAFSPDGTRVMTRSDTRVMDIWEVGPGGGAEVANIADADQLVSFLADGRRVTTSGWDGSLSTLDLETGEKVHQPIEWFEPPRGLYEGYAFNQDGSAVAIETIVASPPFSTTLRNVESGDKLFEADGQPAGVDWSPDGRFVAVAGYGSVTILDVSGGKVGVLRDDGFTLREGVEFGPRNLVAIPATDKVLGEHLRIWDWRRDVFVAKLPVPPDYTTWRFDPDGRRIAIGTADTTIWDVQDERLLVTLPSSQVQSNNIAFSHDGSQLAEADPDGSVRIHDASSGEELLALEGHNVAAEAAFSPDGSMLATVGDGILRIWTLDIDDLLEIARNRITRSFTDEECQQYLHVDRCPSA